MGILGRYIGRTVLLQLLLVTLVLLTVYFFITMMDELGSVGQGNYSLGKALLYTLMLLPRQLYELFPLLALLGGLLGLGTLAGSNELTVIRAAGVSVWRILLAVLQVALLLMLAVTLVGELAAPPLEQQALQMRAEALNKALSLNARGGLWARDGDTYINMQHLLPDGVAHDVSLFVYASDQRLLQVIEAHSAVHDGERWRLRRVQRSVIDPAGLHLERLDEMSWASSLTPDVAGIATLAAEKLAIRDLLTYVAYTRSNNLDASTYELALWSRLVAPLATAGMLLLAVPFVFGSLRSVSIGVRTTLGAMLGIGFHLLNNILGRIALVYDVPALLSALLPTLLVFVLWWGLMQRIH